MSTWYWYKHQSGQIFSLNELVLRNTFVPAVPVLIKFSDVSKIHLRIKPFIMFCDAFKEVKNIGFQKSFLTFSIFFVMILMRIQKKHLNKKRFLC